MNVFSIYFIIKVFHLLDIKIPRMIFKHEKSIIKWTFLYIVCVVASLFYFFRNPIYWSDVSL